MTIAASRYDYQFDPEDNSTAAQVCRLVGPAGHVLELGCAAGAMSRVLREHYGSTVTGVEMDPTAAAKARQYCERVVEVSLDDPSWTESLAGMQFDAVLAADVLEHLRNPLGALRKARGMVKETGHLVVSVPNIAHSGVLAALLSNDFPYRDTGLLDRTHVHHFTALTLGRMLAKAGFEVQAVQTSDAGPWHPEFSRYWDALPERVRAWLEANPVGTAYQVIMLAKPATGTVSFDDSLLPTANDWLAGLEKERVAASEHPALLERQEALETELTEVKHALANAQDEIARMEGSRSWRITAPLRWATGKLGARRTR